MSLVSQKCCIWFVGLFFGVLDENLDGQPAKCFGQMVTNERKQINAAIWIIKQFQTEIQWPNQMTKDPQHTSNTVQRIFT